MSKTLIITRREMRDSLRDWRIVTPILLLTMIFPALMTVTSGLAADVAVVWGAGENARVILGRLVPFSLMIVGFFPISFSLVIALESFVGERERRSIEPLLSMPVSDGELYLGKLLSSMALPLLASYLGIGIYYVGLIVASEYVISAEPLVLVVVLTTMEALVMVAGAVVLSSQTTSVRAANLLASFIIIPVALLLQVEAVLLFWHDYEALWAIVAALLAVDLMLIRTGMRIFNREDLLAREFDEISLPSIWRSFEHLFACLPVDVRLPRDGPAPRVSIRRLYGRDIPQLMRLQRLPLLIAALVLLGALVAGWAVAQAFPLPAGTIDLEGLGNVDWAGDMPDVPLLPGFDVRGIFTHNLRVVGISLALAPLSFGAVPLMLPLPAMLLVGLFAGEAAFVGLNPLVFLAVFILPHGIPELGAVVLAMGFGLRLGASIMSPPPGFSISEGLLLSLADLLKVFVLLVIPLLLLAAVVEVYVTPLVVIRFFGA
ncbi:MAG TPA: stage II sporulation protein M [Anaerolineae bacterium]|nr:stage II sporulation protein M [Anaerolineae bacterium]